MPVVINEFEGVAESPGEQRGEAHGPRKPRHIRPGELKNPLRLLDVRAARIRAH